MSKQLNGIFRSWMSVKQSEDKSPPIIWGHCIVHLSHPEFSGNVLHTSGILEITDHNAFKIAVTQNNYYALLGPELVMPFNTKVDPMTYVMQHQDRSRKTDAFASAAMNAFPGCAKCRGKGTYRRSDRHIAICDFCCQHAQGWWRLEGAYGLDNGRWACKAGCGWVVDIPPLELEFLPRARK